MADTDSPRAPAPPLGTDAWTPLDPPEGGRFDHRLPTIMVRPGPGATAQARVETDARCANVFGTLHGAFLASIAEQTLFLPLYLHGRVARDGAVTVDLGVQYLASGEAGAPLDVRVEALRETGRMAFIRGELRQHDRIVVAFTGALRKVRPAG